MPPCSFEPYKKGSACATVHTLGRVSKNKLIAVPISVLPCVPVSSAASLSVVVGLRLSDFQVFWGCTFSHVGTGPQPQLVHRSKLDINYLDIITLDKGRF